MSIARTLTLSGNEITDAVRTTAVEGDGLTPPAGVGPWPAATNLVTNGGFETNTTGWALNNATLTRITTDAKFGSACARLQWNNASTFYQAQTTFTISGSTAGRQYTGSYWVKGEGDSVGKAVVIRLAEEGGTQAPVSYDSAPFTLTDDWQRVSLTITVAEDDRTAIRYFVGRRLTSLAADESLLVDGIQLEESSVATPYIETDGSTESRAAGRVQMPVAGLFTATQGAVAARLRTGISATATPFGAGYPCLFTWRDDATHEIAIQYNIDVDKWSIVRRAAGATRVNETNAQTFVPGDTLTVTCAWTATTLKATTNATAFNSGADANIPDIAAADADVGSFTNTNWVDSNVLWFATFAGTLTDDDAAALDAFGDTPPTSAQLFNALSAKSLPTSLWVAEDSEYLELETPSYTVYTFI